MINNEMNETVIPTTSKPKKIIIRRKRDGVVGTDSTSQSVGNNKQQHPIIDPVLYEQVTASLPLAYQFEIMKTAHRCIELNVNHVALQLPEGLLMYATVLGDILVRLVPCLQRVSILGDVTYGACCIDDIGAKLLGAQLLVHYGHSCLIPINHQTSNNLPVLYVFVEIQINIEHLVDCLVLTLEEQERKGIYSKTSTNIYLLGTVQFRHALVTVKEILVQSKGWLFVSIPQVKPLSPGEVLGCTSPVLPASSSSSAATAAGATRTTTSKKSNPTITSVVCFVADGRFHMESTMISNPHIDCYYRYDPYSKTITIEQYDNKLMKEIRWNAIQQAVDAIQKAKQSSLSSPSSSSSPSHSGITFGIILGTLGRQGNPAIVQRIKDILHLNGIRSFLLLLSEITPSKLQLFNTDKNHKKVHVWVQIACPRLSIDWGHLLSDQNNPVPVLSPYELFCCFEPTKFWDNSSSSTTATSTTGSTGNIDENNDLSYPMDYYSNVGGPWSNYHFSNKSRSMTSTIYTENIPNSDDDRCRTKDPVKQSTTTIKDCLCMK